MSILDWDDFDNDDQTDAVDISTGSISLDSNELLLNTQLSDDPLSLVKVETVPPAFAAALDRLKVMGLEQGPANTSTDRISRDDKTILGGGDVNQLIPIKYNWAWDKYLTAVGNNWVPTEVNMAKDVSQWKAAGDDAVLSPDERRIIYNALGFFSTADTVVNNNLINIARHIKNPEQRQFIFRQIFEEANHTHAYQYCIQTLNLNESQVFNQYRENLSMSMKDNWCFRFDAAMEQSTLTTEQLLENLIAFYVVMEGIFFYCGFSQVLALGRQGKMIGVAEQFQWILKDESLHLNYGIDLINQIKIENPEVWTPEFQTKVLDMIEEGAVLEMAFGYDINPNGTSVITPQQNARYMQFIAHRRILQLGLTPRFECPENPFPWMAEMMDINKESNFFEKKVSEYQVGAKLDF